MSNKFKISNKSKFDKLIKDKDIFLNYLISDKGVNNIFEISISNANNNQISFFAKIIRNYHLNLFKDIDLSRLKLYMNKANINNIIIHNLKNNNMAILDNTELMNLENTIYSYFNN